MSILDNEGHCPMGLGNARTDRAEIKSLRAEIERVQQAKRGALAVANERSKENVALRAEVERLRAAIKEIDAQSIASTDPQYVAVPAKLIADAIAATTNEQDNKCATI